MKKIIGVEGGMGEAECCPDQISMLLEMLPRLSVSAFVGYWKGKSSLMLSEQVGERKFKHCNRRVWRRGCLVGTVGRNKAEAAEYARHQATEDKVGAHRGIPCA